jgi:hypothetical protein
VERTPSAAARIREFSRAPEWNSAGWDVGEFYTESWNDPAPETLAGILWALRDSRAIQDSAARRATEERLLTRLSEDARLVPSVALVRGARARETVRCFLQDDDPQGRRHAVRRETGPQLRLWAVRGAWADAQRGRRTFRLTPQGTLRRGDPLELPFSDFAQWFHQRAMQYLSAFSVPLAERWWEVDQIFTAPVLPRTSRTRWPARIEREHRLLDILTRGPLPPRSPLGKLLSDAERHKVLAALLGTTPGAMRARFWRRTRSAKGDP